MSTTTGADTAQEAAAYNALLHILTDMLSGPVGRLADGLVNAGVRPPARVISGDVELVTAALDGLPVGSIITCDEQDTDLVYHLIESATGARRWWVTAYPRHYSAADIARHQVPITVLREGTGA